MLAGWIMKFCLKISPENMEFTPDYCMFSEEFLKGCLYEKMFLRIYYMLQSIKSCLTNLLEFSKTLFSFSSYSTLKISRKTLMTSVYDVVCTFGKMLTSTFAYNLANTKLNSFIFHLYKIDTKANILDSTLLPVPSSFLT